MSTVSIDPSYYADFGALASLKTAAKANDPKAVRAAAQQFESLFTNMLLKSMREARLGPGLGDSDQTDFYTDMFDQQLATEMSKGHGLGLADMLVRQLTQSGQAPGANKTGVAGGTAATPRAPAPATAAERLHFVHQITPFAQQAAGALGVSCDALVAQAALETGWGKHLPADASGRSSCNLFGVKTGGSWNGARVAAATTEYAAGASGASGAAGAHTVVQPFRVYDSVADSVGDYVSLLRGNPRYAAALGTGDDTLAFASALQRGGYATDPDYVQKLQATTASVKALRAASDMAPQGNGLPPLKITAQLPTTSSGESA